MEDRALRRAERKAANREIVIIGCWISLVAVVVIVIGLLAYYFVR